MSLIVFGTSVSPFVRKVRIVLTEKGLLYRHENVNEAKPPDGWRELSPLGKIPAFKDCDRALAGSLVICAYLERRFPMPPLYPSEPYDYARALWFEDYMDDGFAPLGRSKVFLPLIVEPLLAGKPGGRRRRPGCCGQSGRQRIPRILGLSRARARRRRVFCRRAPHYRRHCDRERPCELAICRRCARAQPLATPARIP